MTRKKNPLRPRRAEIGALTLLPLLAGAVLATTLAAAPANAANGTLIRHWKTGKCLDSNSAGHVYPLGCNHGANQKWVVQQYQPGSNRIRNVATGRCLDTNGKDVYTLPCQDPNSWQKWRLYHNGNRVQFENIRTNKCLDTNGGSVYAHGCNRGEYQNWRLGF
ncbi:xylanase [Spongiactinospora rosea]|uniref:Xylanase n=1 Tax=Spongiactinospora rosea TaxID=2248750 RepID=A0A366LP20_9ACTN|nr:RICIN domain-containing protein [Spongiactinospora rosea]RBQ15034.1 xylanase [Spongiactinospora rosea]